MWLFCCSFLLFLFVSINLLSFVFYLHHPLSHSLPPVCFYKNPVQFGDSQQLRLVRILRSTVMVRVGGGWMALDEFLVKNDPCRGEWLSLSLSKILFFFLTVFPRQTDRQCQMSHQCQKQQFLHSESWMWTKPEPKYFHFLPSHFGDKYCTQFFLKNFSYSVLLLKQSGVITFMSESQSEKC